MNININSPICKISKSDKIILDTNILLMVFYSKYIQKDPKYKKGYQDFVNKCLCNKNKLYTTEININEAFHVIDKTALDLYNNKYKTSIGIKEFHKITSELIQLHEDMKVFYNCVKEAIIILPSGSLNEWITGFFSNDAPLDLYDYFLINATKNNNIKNILTDDEDFIHDKELIKELNILSQNSKIFNEKD